MSIKKYKCIEVPLGVCMFSQFLEGAISTNLFVYRTCYVILGYNQSDCEQLGNEENNITAWLEPKVQPTVNHINMVNNTLTHLIPIIFSLCVGTWSDKFGRKPFLVLSLAGLAVSTSLHVVVVHFPYLSPWWFVITSIPTLLVGGVQTLMIVICTFIIDNSFEENRVFRLGLFDIILALSSVLGNLTSSYLFYATSYQTVYWIATGLTGLSFFYTIFFIPESLKGVKQAFSMNELVKAINVKDLVKSTIRKRENNARPYLFGIVGILLLFGLASGDGLVGTLFVRAKLHWTLSKITIVNSVASFGNIFATFFGISFLHKTLKIKEITLCLFGIVLICISNILRGIATNDYYIYAAVSLSIFFALPGLMLRTIMSLMVPTGEMGKIFALLSVISNLISVLSTLVYPLIYNATLQTYSGMYNFVTFGIHSIVGLCVLSMIKVKFPYYKPSEDEERIHENKGIEKDKNPRKYSEPIISNRNLLAYIDITEARRLSQPT